MRFGYLRPRHWYGAPPTHAPSPPPPPHPCDLLPVLWFATVNEKKPRTYFDPAGKSSIGLLATALVREAAGAPIEGVNQVASFYGDTKTRRVVAVWTLNEGGGRNRFLGYVWLGGVGDGRARLGRALQALELGQAA